MTKGKVVLVPFPFDDLSAIKVRPAVCLTNQIGQYNHIIISTNKAAKPPITVVTDTRNFPNPMNGRNKTLAKIAPSSLKNPLTKARIDSLATFSGNLSLIITP